MKKIIILSIIFLLFCSIGFSQEVLTGLYVNSKIHHKKCSQSLDNKHKSTKSVSVKLPFRDDFSSGEVFPDDSLWIDNFVFVNSDYPVNPVTIGVATFDALNDFGMHYSNAGTNPYVSDYLTSRFIRLDYNFAYNRNMRVSDSLYLSFYYQPGGGIGNPWEKIGNSPNQDDSLVLEFLLRQDSTWITVNSLYLPGDTIWINCQSRWITVNSFLHPIDSILLPGDTIKSPTDTVVIPNDSILLPGDSIFLPKDSTWLDINQYLHPADSVLIPGDSVWVACDSIWKKIWATEGMTLDTFYNKYNTYFKQVMIRIIDSAAFYRNDFQFRFKNYVSLNNNNQESWAGNVDQWHIDYVYLNTARTINDTIFDDAAFIEKQNSLLVNYQSMPWKQFLANSSAEMRNTDSIPISNLSNLPPAKNVNRHFIITDLIGTGTPYDAYPGGSAVNINPLTIDYFEPTINYTYNSNSVDSAEFKVLDYFETTPDVNRNNDTICFYQKFYNYYAYDDGNPENGYGLNAPNGGEVACGFTLNQQDTLRAIQMLFNQTYNNGNQEVFYLSVWDDNNGKPGNVVYEKSGILPEYEDSLNEYHTYRFDDTLIVLNGVFYVGWWQKKDFYMNIGYDRNTNSQTHLFYNTDGTWYNSMYPGSIMIRPVFGKKLPPEPQSIKETQKESAQLRIYPNPLRENILNIMLLSPNNKPNSCIISIYDVVGKQVYTSRYQPSIDISDLSDGVYVVRVTDRTNAVSYTERLIIAR